MAECTSATEVPVVPDEHVKKDVIGTADHNDDSVSVDKIETSDENVNKDHENISDIPNGNKHEPIGSYLTDGKPLKVEDFKGNERVCIESNENEDNKTCNNNANDGPSDKSCATIQPSTHNNIDEASHSDISYNKITTVTEQIPFHPAVNGNHCDGITKPTRKGIRFPQDSVILGFCEPADPWKSATLWTTDELISAYKSSCELHGCKPVVKVLQQLSAISGPGKREDQFSLKGEKLDHRQCECVEEVLRRVQFKLLDFESSHLDDECAGALFDMIEYYESACQLNISCNKDIGARGWQACSRLVRRTPSLTYLDIRGCEMNDRTIPIFGRALKLGCHLTILHMEKMNLSGRPLIILGAALKMNETLQELFLADNKLVPTDGAQLGNLLRYNHRLGLLDLRNNHLADVGTNHICEGLSEQSKGRGLRTLVLWSNSITYQAMPALGRSLAISESLETLNIGHNAITNEGVHLLKDGLLKTITLLRLGLQGTKVSDEGAVALAEFIADSLILLRIDLRDNDIKTGGLMALSHAMRVNTSVTRIDLDKDTKRESSMKDYAEQQNRLQRDIITFQQRNVQTAIEREEMERAQLEEKAEALFAAAKKREEEELSEGDEKATSKGEEEGSCEGDEKGTSKGEEEGSSEEEAASATQPPSPPHDGNGVGGESFTLIGKEDIAITDLSTSSSDNMENDECNLPPESQADTGISPASSCSTASISINELNSGKSSSDSENDDGCKTPESAQLVSTEDRQHHLRPRNLFSHPTLSSQESLDSPLPCAIIDRSDITEDTVDESEGSLLSSSPAKDSMDYLTHSMGASPGEMLLSPQYYPKQLAKKIFSVSRVSEDGQECSSPPSSPSPPLSPSDMSHSSKSSNLLNARSSLNGSDEPFSSITSGDPLALLTLRGIESSLAENSLIKEDHTNEIRKQSDSCVDADTEIANSGVLSSDKSTIDTNSEDDLKNKTFAADSSHVDSETSFAVSCDRLKQLEAPTSKESDNIATEYNDNQEFSNFSDSSTHPKDQLTPDAHTHIGGDPHLPPQQSPSLNYEPTDEERCVKQNDSAQSQDTSLPVTQSLTSSSLHCSDNTCIDNVVDTDSPTASPAVLPVSDNNSLDVSELSLCEEAPTEVSSNSALMTSITHTTTEADSESKEDNVDLSLEEEPWLAVGRDVEEHNNEGESNKGEVPEVKPDFFTTLSHNGLTQELASAVTSLDSVDNGPDDIDIPGQSDIHTEDEFEKELDAMIAGVKADRMWNIEDS